MMQSAREDVIRLLANDALEAVGDSGADAAMLLVDAALSLMLTRLGPAGAYEMTGLFFGYIMQQGDAMLATGSDVGGAG